MSPRVQLSLLTAVLVLAGSAPAFADSTTTGTVPPGGSLRSSPDAEPSAANPVIVTVTTSGEYGSSSCRSNCSQGDSQVTIGLKDQHVHPAPGDSKPFYVVGPQVDVASSQNLNIDRIVFEIDSSVIRPNFALGVGEFEGRIWRPGDAFPTPARFEEPGKGLGGEGLVERLPGGDVRLTVQSGVPGGPVLATSSIDLLQQAWWIFSYAAGTDLDDARSHGVSVEIHASYRAAEVWTVTVSQAVARKLKLKSTTIGRASLPNPGTTRRIPLTKAARRALRKYSRVAVKLNLTATESTGDIHRQTWPLKLAKQESELE